MVLYLLFSNPGITLIIVYTKIAMTEEYERSSMAPNLEQVLISFWRLESGQSLQSIKYIQISSIGTFE